MNRTSFRLSLNEFNLISAEITSIDAWASSIHKNLLPKFAWNGGNNFFHSKKEDNPWLRIQLNRKETITSVTVRNRLDCCGKQLENLEVRAGTKNDTTNEIVGTFEGPGVTGGRHVVQFIKSVVADFLTFQLMKKNGILQISGIYLNESPILGKYDSQIDSRFSWFIKIFSFQFDRLKTVKQLNSF